MAPKTMHTTASTPNTLRTVLLLAMLLLLPAVGGCAALVGGAAGAGAGYVAGSEASDD